jgi:hypothetical protein
MPDRKTAHGGNLLETRERTDASAWPANLCRQQTKNKQAARFSPMAGLLERIPIEWSHSIGMRSSVKESEHILVEQIEPICSE